MKKILFFIYLLFGTTIQAHVFHLNDIISIKTSSGTVRDYTVTSFEKENYQQSYADKSMSLTILGNMATAGAILYTIFGIYELKTRGKVDPTALSTKDFIEEMIARKESENKIWVGIGSTLLIVGFKSILENFLPMEYTVETAHLELKK